MTLICLQPLCFGVYYHGDGHANCGGVSANDSDDDDHHHDVTEDDFYNFSQGQNITSEYYFEV